MHYYKKIVLSVCYLLNPETFTALRSMNMKYGAAALPQKNEDRSTIISSYNNDPDQWYVGLFDGHGGAQVADKACKKLNDFFSKSLSPKKTIKDSFEDAFAAFDLDLFVNRFEKNEKNELVDTIEDAGSTALVIYTYRDDLYCANVGDCRAVLYSQKEVTPLSRDLTPYQKDEVKRVIDAGGKIFYPTENIKAPLRVYSDDTVRNPKRISLMVSRSLGDFYLKNYPDLKAPIISFEPEVKYHQLRKEDEFIIVASDGMWDVFENEKAGKIVNAALKKGKTAQEIATLLALKSSDKRAANKMRPDDITVIILLLSETTESNSPPCKKQCSQKDE